MAASARKRPTGAGLPLPTIRAHCGGRYVIYMFFTLLTAYLGGEDCLIDYLELKSHMQHPSPLRRCMRPIR